MTYPEQTPTTAPYNADGYDVPVGWVIEYTYNAEDVRNEVPVPYRRIESTRLRIGNQAGYVYSYSDSSALLTQDPSLLPKYYYHFIRLLELVWYARLGMIGASGLFQHFLPNGNRFCDMWELKSSGNSTGENTVRLSRNPDPYALTMQDDTTLTALMPGDLLRIGRQEGVILDFGTLEGNTVVYRIHKPIIYVDGATVLAFRQSPALWFQMQTNRAKVCEELSTGWRSGSIIELLKSNGLPGQIAYPHEGDGEGYRGNLHVWGWKPDGTVDDITATVLTGFPGRGSGVCLKVLPDESGVYHSTIDTSFLSPYTKFWIKYVMETPRQSAPGLGQWHGSQFACDHVCRDWSNTIGTSGSTGTCIDASGGHWFCDYLDKSGVLGTGFSENCFNTECPYFFLRDVFRPNLSRLEKLTHGRNIYYKTNITNANEMDIDRAENPSLFELAGQPAYTGEGTAFEQIIWASKCGPIATGTGLFGVLMDVPESQKSEDEGAIKGLSYPGAISKIGGGLLALAGPYTRPDRAGGKGSTQQNQFDDGSDFFWNEAYQPMGEMFVARTDKNAFIEGTKGGSEACVQRVKPHTIRIPGIILEVNEINQKKTVKDTDTPDALVSSNAAGDMVISAYPLHKKIFEEVNIKAKTISRATLLDAGNILRLSFKNEKVSCSDLTPDGQDTTASWTCAGGTVAPLPEDRIYNPKSEYPV